MDKHRAHTWDTLCFIESIFVCQDWWNCTKGGLIIPELIIIIIPVMMHSHWYCLTHRNIATSLIFYQKLDLNNT